MSESDGGGDGNEQTNGMSAAQNHKLHPLTLLLDFISLIPSLGFAFVALTWSSFNSEIAWLLPLIIPAAFLIPMVLKWLAWSRFSYTIAEKDLRIQSGVLSRQNRSIPFERIQDVNIEQKLIHRVFGLASLSIETGGSAGNDDKLNAVSLAEAERLRDIIRDRKAGFVSKDSSHAGEQTVEEEAEPLFAMDNRRIFIAGLFNFSIVLLAILAAVAQNLDFLLPSEYFDPWYWAGQWADQDIIDSMSISTRVFSISAAVISLIAIGEASGIVRTFVREYGFRLERVKIGFRRRRGLFTLSDMVMPIHRVQAAILRTGPIRERFGWYHLKFQSLASDANDETDHSAAPCAKMSEIVPILAETDIRNAPEDMAFQGVNSAMWWRDALLMALIFGAIAIGNGIFVHPGLYALFLLWFPLTIWMILNWRRHRFALNDIQLFVHRGWWSRKLTILPLRKIQTVDVEQSPFDHTLDLATVTLGVAGGSAISTLKISDIGFEEAMTLRSRLLPPNSSLTLTREHSR